MKADSSLGELGRASWRVCLMWMRGWTVFGRSILAYLIVGLFSVPLGWLVNHLSRFPDQRGPVAVLLLAGFLVYLPLVFYIAGSWIGFCPYVGDEEIDPISGVE